MVGHDMGAPDGPDPDNPETMFWDGGSLYEIEVLPAAFPIWGSQGDNPVIDSATFIGFLAYSLLGGLLAWLVDRRWKVVVSRNDGHRFSQWRVVDVVFAPDQDAADSQREAILRGWVSLQYAETLPLSRSDIRRRRRTSKAQPA